MYKPLLDGFRHDRDTTDCNCEYHVMGPLARMVMCLEMDLDVEIDAIAGIEGLEMKMVT
jgi:hypothetical protein